LQWLKALKAFAEEQKIDFDFVILKANQFNSGFAKDAFAKIQIEFDTLQKPCYFEKVTNTLKAERSSREKFLVLVKKYVGLAECPDFGTPKVVSYDYLMNFEVIII